MKPLKLLVTVMALLGSGCSSTPSGSVKDAASAAAPAAPAKPLLDFGTVDVAPASGSGREATLRVSVKAGPQKPAMIWLLINDRQNGGDACYVSRNLVTNDNSLVADTGSGAISLGKEKSVANRQCELLRNGTDSTADASGIVATFHVRFRPGFRGSKHTWVMPTDAVGNGQLKQAGDWTVQ